MKKEFSAFISNDKLVLLLFTVLTLLTVGYLIIISYPYFFSKINRFYSLGFLSAVEEKHENIEKTYKGEHLIKGEKITGKFLATDNNLGIILIRFVPLSAKVSDNVTFRIKQDGGQKWHYENSYHANQFQPNEYFTFGFPPIKGSRGNTYIFEVESQSGTTKNGIGLSSKKPQASFVYKYSKEDLKNFSILFSFISKKIIYASQNANLIGNWQILLAFILSALLALVIKVNKIIRVRILKFLLSLRVNFKRSFKVLNKKSKYFFQKNAVSKKYKLFISSIKKIESVSLRVKKRFQNLTQMQLFMLCLLIIGVLVLFVYQNPFLRKENVILGEIMNQWSYPNLVTKTNLARGIFPLWDNFSAGGYSFIGHPQSQLLYLPSFFTALVFADQILGMRFIFFVHLLLLGYFTTLLLRMFTKNIIIILPVVTLTLFNRYILGNINNGYPAEIFSLTWLPLIFYCLLKWEKTGKAYILIGAALAFSMLIYSGALFGVHFSLIAVGLFFALVGIKKFFQGDSFRQILTLGIYFVLFIGLVIFFSAPRLVPILEYKDYSMRNQLSLNDAEQNSLDKKMILDYASTWIQRVDLVPSYIQEILSATYLALAVLIIYFILFKRKGLFEWFLLILSIISLMSMMGKYAPFLNLYRLFYYFLPGFQYNLYPGRFVLLLYFAVPFILAFALGDLLKSRDRKQSILGYSAAFLIVLTTVIAIKHEASNFAYEVFSPQKAFLLNDIASPKQFYRWHNNAIASIYGHPYISLLNNQFTLNSSYPQIAPITLYPNPLTQSTKGVNERFLNAKYKTLSVWSVRYEVEQDEYSDFDIPNNAATLITKDGDLKIYKLNSYSPFINEVENPIFFVTSGNFDDVSIKSRALFLKYVTDPLKTYIISSPKEKRILESNSKIPTILDSNLGKLCLQENLCLAVTFKNYHGYDIKEKLNSLYYRRETVLLDDDSDMKIKKFPYISTQPEKQNYKRARVFNIGPITRGKISFEVINENPTYLAISQNYYPGWKAFVDGEETPILLGDGMVQIVPIRISGTHKVTMTYEPDSFKIGLLLFFVGAPLTILVLRKFSNMVYIVKNS